MNSYSFPKSSRDFSPLAKLRNHSPGPGHYTPAKVGTSVSYTIQTRSAARITHFNPGPSSYSPKFVIPTSRQQPFTRERRQLFVISTSQDRLAKPQQQRGCLPSQCAPQAWSQLTIRETPGPGSYEVNPIKNSASYSAMRRPVEKTDLNSPGPGSYTPKSQARVRSSSFSRSRRTSLGKEPLPGPADYHTQAKSRAPGQPFSKARRFGSSPTN